MDNSAAPTPTRSTRSMKSSKIDADKTVDPWSSKTPEKSMQLRGRNRGVALSLKDVKRVAKGLRESDVDFRSSTKRKLLSCPDGKAKAVEVDQTRSSLKLPERYEMLCETFHSLDCVVRLMRMKGVSPAFSNVCRKVEQLTDRRFTYEQLAQVKFILPEAIVLKKISVLDEATNCMKYDIHISFDLDAIKTDGKVKGGRPQLSKVFRSRLIDFYKSHSEDSEIPEGPLPEPFGKPSIGSSPPTITDPINSPVTAEPATDHLLNYNTSASHISHSFRKSFSKRTGSHEEASSIQSETTLTSEPAATKSRLSRCTFKEETDVRVTSPLIECYMEAPGHYNSSAKASTSCSPTSSLQATPCKQRSADDTPSKIEKTLLNFGSVPTASMTATPAPSTPKRSLMSPDDENSNKTSNKLVRRAVRARSLKFDTPLKGDVEDKCIRMKVSLCSSIDSELADTLDEDLLQSIMEKEQKAREVSDPAISQAKRRRDMIAGLPKLFNMVHFYFRSVKRSVVTKEELMHNMVVSHSEFLDRREVEEQLKLLQELAPEYISESVALSGDKLIRVNKVSNAESIRARLAEAI